MAVLKKKNENEKRVTTFFGGIPTQIDIDKLRKEYPENELNVGDIISYSDVESLLRLDRKNLRFRTVTWRWRKIVEKETNIIIGVEPSVGFKILSEKEKVLLSGSKIRSAVRAARRSYVIGSRVDRKQLEPHMRDALDHQESVNAKILAAGQIKNNQILPEM